jgi:hypothetical protein
MVGKKNPATERNGGPGASHEHRTHPEKSQARGRHPVETQSTRLSGVSGGGGEPDAHHSHDPRGKGGK